MVPRGLVPAVKLGPVSGSLVWGSLVGVSGPGGHARTARGVVSRGRFYAVVNLVTSLQCQCHIRQSIQALASLP